MGGEGDVFQGGVVVFLAEGIGELIFYGKESGLKGLEAGAKPGSKGDIGGIAGLLEKAEVLPAF